MKRGEVDSRQVQRALENLGEEPGMGMGGASSYDLSKRIVDLAIAIPIYVVTLPVQAIVAAAILVHLGRPILFVQDRPGLHGEVFRLIKFRTMKTADDGAGSNNDAIRTTGLGRLLRATSVDELPTLLNVIKGDMSLVGPRPLLVEYLPMYTAEEARRHDVRPGITGLAQVNGRNSLAWEEKFELDIKYVDHRSMRLDLLIMLKTVKAVLAREGISAQGEVTMPKFSRPTWGKNVAR